MEDVVQTVSLPAQAGATEAVELVFSPHREQLTDADVERVGPVLWVRDAHDPTRRRGRSPTSRAPSPAWTAPA